MKIIQPNAIETIVSAVNKYVKFIAPTYGPAGTSVLIAPDEFNIKAPDDGYAITSEYEIETDEFENAVIMYIKKGVEKANSKVGDGTCTTGLLVGAIVNGVVGDINDPFNDKKYHKKVLEVKKATKEAVEVIRSKAKQINNKEELKAIAYNSYNNEEIAELISETLFKIGKDGLLAIEDSQTANTEVEIVEGLELEKGYASPYFINTSEEDIKNKLADKKEDKVILDDPVIIVVDGKINSFIDILPLIKNIINNQKREIVVIAEGFSEEVLKQFIIQRIHETFSPLLVETPGFSDKLDNLKNLCAVIGAKLINPKITKFSEVNLEDLGNAKKVVSSQGKTVFIAGSGDITERITSLESQLKEAKDEFTQEKIKKHIATLKGGIALIKVGANTEQEQKTIKAKVEDAVNATKIAFKDGVVDGGGKTYVDIQTSSEILNKALKNPLEQLEANGKEFLDENTIDPAGVLITALETATSIACGLLTMSGIIATKKKEEKE